MGVTVGPSKMPYFSDLVHYYDPRNPRCNLKTVNYYQGSTEYRSAIGGTSFTVTDQAMLHPSGVLDFPVPSSGNGATYYAKYGENFSGFPPDYTNDTKYIEMDTATTFDGYCWMQWIKLDKVPNVNEHNGVGSTFDRELPLFTAPRGHSSNESNDVFQLSIYWDQPDDTNRTTDPDYKYGLAVYNKSIGSTITNDQKIYKSAGKIPKDQWVCIGVQGNDRRQSPTGIPGDNQYYDVYIDNVRVASDEPIDRTTLNQYEPAGLEPVWRLKYLGVYDYGGAIEPMSFVGQMGPSVFFTKRIRGGSGTEVDDPYWMPIYEYFKNSLPD